MLRALLVVFILTALCGITKANAEPTYRIENDISYVPEGQADVSDYQRVRCRLDVYYPEGETGFATVVWFHGGGLSAGSRHIPEGLKKQGLAIVPVNYRLHPKVTCPVYIQDAAAAVAWTFRNIEHYGGDANKIFISGASAGGYLTSMLGMDKRWLAECGIDADQIAGLIPLTGHTITHMTIREERGIPKTQPVVDEFAPLYHVRADAPPILLMTGDREMEMLGRYEENAYFMRMLRVAGHKDVTFYEIQGYPHNMVEPAVKPMLKWIREKLAQQADGGTEG